MPARRPGGASNRRPRRHLVPDPGVEMARGGDPGRQSAGSLAMPSSARRYSTSAASSSRSTTLPRASLKTGRASHASGSIPASRSQSSGR